MAATSNAAPVNGEQMAEATVAEDRQAEIVPEPVQPEPEPEPEPELVSAITEPVLSAFAEPVSFDEEPDSAVAATAPPKPAEPEPEPGPEPVPVNASQEPQSEPRPEPVQAAMRTPGVSETLVAWPTGSPSAPPENGAPSEAASFEEATSVIPAWQPTETDSRQTVSMQAMPPDEVASGAGFAAVLTFESGPFSGRIVALPDQMVSIGRAPDNDVVVGDPATSGHHGRIEMRSGSFWISDLGSTNGTQVNGQPVIEKQLSDGDMIAIGQNTLRFTLEA